MIFRALIQSDYIRPAAKPSDKNPDPQPSRILNLIEVVDDPNTTNLAFRDTISVRCPEGFPQGMGLKFVKVALVEYSQFKDGGVTFRCEILAIEGVNWKPTPVGAPAPAAATHPAMAGIDMQKLAAEMLRQQSTPAPAPVPAGKA